MAEHPRVREFTVAEFRELSDLYGANVACALFERAGAGKLLTMPLSIDATVIIEMGIREERAQAWEGVQVCREVEGETLAALPTSETYHAGRRLATCDNLIDLFERPDFRLLVQFTI